MCYFNGLFIEKVANCIHWIGFVLLGRVFCCIRWAAWYYTLVFLFYTLWIASFFLNDCTLRSRCLHQWIWLTSRYCAKWHIWTYGTAGCVPVLFIWVSDLIVSVFYTVGTSLQNAKPIVATDVFGDCANTAQKVKFSIKNFFIKCDDIRRKLRIWPHLMKKYLMENFIFCTV